MYIIIFELHICQEQEGASGVPFATGQKICGKYRKLYLRTNYKNIDSCMLQWIRNKQGEKVLKNLLHISDTEEIVRAIGYRADNAKILISTRKPICDIVRKV